MTDQLISSLYLPVQLKKARQAAQAAVDAESEHLEATSGLYDGTCSIAAD
jgi:hypothetical protein